MLVFYVNPGDALPIYRQIVQQVVDAIAGGKLQAGDRLPSHRDLAIELVIAPLTVKKAYDELERQGFIRMARGQGTFVRDAATSLSKKDKLMRLRPLAERLISTAALLDVGTREVKALVDEQEKARRRKRATATSKRQRKP